MITLIHRSFRIVTCLMALFLFQPIAYAAENENPDKSENAQGEDNTDQQASDSTRTAQKPSNQKKRKPDDVFNPSEEISEDFAVSFPVDI